jgi:hypothetical protein
MRRFINTFPRISAWLVFLGGLAALLFADHNLRMRDGRIWDGGIPEMLSAGMLLALGCLSVWLLWFAAKNYKHRLLGILEIIGHVIIGYALLCVILLYYTVKTGIDSL